MGGVCLNSALEYEEDRSHILRGKLLALLNKISPENEAKLIQCLSDLQPRSSKELLIIAEMVFEKALSDSLYCCLYKRVMGKLCVDYPTFKGPIHAHDSIDDLKVKAKENSPMLVTFASLIAQCCQQEFKRLLD